MFQSFFIGGFECSTHRGRRGNRHDLIASTQHDKFALSDYRLLRGSGITVAREGLRWHLIEREPGRFDFSSALPILQAARKEQIQVLWDLFHYGFPDDVNPFDLDFPFRLARFGAAFAHFLKEETDEVPFICPFNEISFFTYAAGERGFFAPHQHGRGDELKLNLVRAAIAAGKAIRGVLPQTQFLQIDPVFNILPAPQRPFDREIAESYRLAQYEGWDMLTGRLKPELGGEPEMLDVVGVNYYSYNQWYLANDSDSTAPGTAIKQENPDYRPFHQILEDVYERYQKPILIAETGTENEDRASWLRYVSEEARIAMTAGVPVMGICWYPILNHPGWDDDRHCHNGLWDYCDDAGCRQVYEPLAREIREQQKLFAAHFVKLKKHSESLGSIHKTLSPERCAAEF